MGNNKLDNRNKDQRFEGGRYSFPGVGGNGGTITYKRPRKMFEAKAVTLFFADILGVSFTAFGIVTTINNLKEACIFILGLTWALCRLYFYIRRSWVALRKEEWEQKERELNKKP